MLKKILVYPPNFKAHISLWVILMLYSVIETALACDIFRLLPYLVSIWVVNVLFFYMNYVWFCKWFFIKKYYFTAFFIMLVLSFLLNYIYVHIQMIIPVNYCSQLLEADTVKYYEYFWIYYEVYVYQSFAIILFSFGFYYFDNNSNLKLKQKDHYIQYLKDQVSPHYILNELSSIIYTGHKEPDKMIHKIEDLSDWLIYSLYKVEKDKIDIHEEIKQIELFLNRVKNQSINKENIQWNIAIDENVNIQLPPLMFFNFIENAVKFSNIYTNNEASIYVSLTNKNKQLEFNITNSIDLKYMDKFSHGGLGINNAIQRLEVFYPDKYELKQWKENGLYYCQLILN